MCCKVAAARKADAETRRQANALAQTSGNGTPKPVATVQRRGMSAGHEQSFTQQRHMDMAELEISDGQNVYQEMGDGRTEPMSTHEL